MRSNRPSCSFRVRGIGLRPAADEPAGFVQRAGGVFVAARVEIVHLHGEPEKEAELFQAEIGAGKMAPPLARIGRLDQRFQHVERRFLDAVAEQEFLGAREIFDRGNQPEQELEMRLDGGAVLARLVFMCMIPTDVN